MVVMTGTEMAAETMESRPVNCCNTMLTRMWTVQRLTATLIVSLSILRPNEELGMA